MSNILTFRSVNLASKLSDNRTGNKTDNKLVTFRKQTGNNDNNKVTEKHRTGNVTDNDDVSMRCLIESIKQLHGIQKIIFDYVIKLCTNRGCLNTGNVFSQDLALLASCSIGSIKTSVIRLIEKKLIVRLNGKQCRGGYMVLGITHEILSAHLTAERCSITDNKRDNIELYSSSYYKNKTTNNTQALPDEWKEINIEPLRHIGFSELQLRQLFKSNMTEADIVQDSIYKFAFALEYNEKIRNYPNPLNVFMGVLRKGNVWIEANYVPPKVIALRELQEEKQKIKDECDAIIKKLVDLEFPEWKRNLTEVEIEAIVPKNTLRLNTSAAVTAALRVYFVERVLLPRIE